MKKAFSLIELLVAFGVIALIAGISVTYLRQAAPGSLLRASARDLATDLRYGSELAVGTQINHAIQFNPATSQYTVIARTVPEQILKTVSLNESLTFSVITLPDNTVEFNSLGGALTAGSVVLQHQNGATATIDIRPSGYVKIL